MATYIHHLILEINANTETLEKSLVLRGLVAFLHLLSFSSLASGFHPPSTTDDIEESRIDTYGPWFSFLITINVVLWLMFMGWTITSSYQRVVANRHNGVYHPASRSFPPFLSTLLRQTLLWLIVDAVATLSLFLGAFAAAVSFQNTHCAAIAAEGIMSCSRVRFGLAFSFITSIFLFLLAKLSFTTYRYNKTIVRTMTMDKEFERAPVTPG